MMFAFNRKEGIAIVALALALFVGGVLSLIDRFRPGTAAEFQILPGVVEVPEEIAGDSLDLSRETLDLNTATAFDLERLPGIGPKIAERIVRHREKSGPFRSVEALKDVRGIGDRTLEKLTPLITVEPVPPVDGVRKQGDAEDGSLLESGT